MDGTADRMLSVLMLSRWVLVYAFCILQAFNAAPVTEQRKLESCAEFCSAESDVADLGVFKSHVYLIRINHRISSLLQANGCVHYAINGTAEIVGGTDCNYELRLKEVAVRKIDVSGTEKLQDEAVRLLEANILHFGYDNGVITALCFAKNETIFARNIKVAILSHLQVTMKSFHLPSLVIEDDISGRCLTRYFPQTSIERADAWKITRVKSTAGCANKYSRKTRFDGVDLGLAQDNSNSMIVDGTQTCTLTLLAVGTVSHAECSENMTISGMFRGNLTIINTVSVDTVVHLISSETGASPSSGKEESIKRIAFGHTADFADIDNQAVDMVEASQSIAAVLVSDFTDRATFFANLIRLVRKMELKQLEELYNIYRDTEQAKDLLTQAIVNAGTKAALNHLMNEIIKGRLNVPILQLSLLPSPTFEQIEIIGHFLNKTDAKESALVISNLLDRYCQSHAHCLQEEIILKNLRQLESNLGNNCSTDAGTKTDEVIITLRAIGNLGRVSNLTEILPVFDECLRHSNTFVRSATAEAFRKFPCDERIDARLLKTLWDDQEQADVRIQAYLSWSRCLTEEKLRRLLAKFPRDLSPQVKSFVQSHLVSIRDSQDPFKSDRRRLLESLQIDLRSSHGYADAILRRQSMYFEKHNYPGQFGGGMESTIIYGPTSPLPRYASVNVTFRGFGRSFNLLEVGYRSEFGGKLRHALLNEPEEMPSVHDAAPFPYQAQNFTFYPGSDRRSSAFVRLFGHEVFLSMDADEDFKGLYPARAMQSSLLEVDEFVSLPTVGGLSLQVSMLGVSSQKLKYDLNWTGLLIDFDARLSASLQTSVALLTPSGPIGFQTNDKLLAGLPFYFKFDWPPSRYSADFLLGGTKPNQQLFKYERLTQEIGQEKLTPLQFDGVYSKTIFRAPALLDKILGLSVQVSKTCNSQLDLCNTFALEVSRFDGLAFFFARQDSGSIELLCGHPGLHRSGTKAENLLLFRYQPDRGDLAFTSRFPWDLEYGFFGHYSGSEFDGSLTFGKWNARLNGSLVTTSSDEWEMRCHLSSHDRGLKLIYKKAGPYKYYLLLENTGRLLPFYLLSANDYVCSTNSTSCDKAWNHTSVLSTRNAGIHLRIHSQNGTCTTNDATFGLYWDAHEQKKATSFSYWAKKCPLPEANCSSVSLYNSSLSLLYQRGEETEWQLTAGSLIIGSVLSQRLTVNSSHWLNISKVPLLSESQPNSVSGINAQVDGYLILFYMTEPWNRTVIENFSLNATYTDDSMRTYGLKSRLYASEKRYAAIITSPKSSEVHIDTKYAIETGQTFLAALNSSIQAFNKSKRYAVKTKLFISTTERTTRLLYSLEETSSNSSLLLAKATIQTPYHWQLPLNCSLSFVLPLELKHSQITCSSELFLSPNKVSFDIAAWNQTFAALTQGRGFTAGLRYDFENLRVFEADGHLKVYQDPTAEMPHSLSFTARQRKDDDFRLYVFRAQTSAGSEVNVRVQQEEDKVFLRFAIKPAVRTETFKGIFYESTSRCLRTSSEFILTHTGEWNANLGFAPAMPFRYGLEYTHAPNFTTGQVYLYADDSLLGKLIRIELAELMYDYSCYRQWSQYQFNSEGMLNWRRYLGRGTVGSHVTLNGIIDTDFREGNLEVVVELPDQNQSHLRLLLDYEKQESRFSLAFNTSLAKRLIYALNTSLIKDYDRKFDFVGRFSTVTHSAPIIELQILRVPVCRYRDPWSYRSSDNGYKQLIGSLKSSLALLPSLTLRYDNTGSSGKFTGHLSYRNRTYVDTFIRAADDQNNLDAHFLSSNTIMPIKANIKSTYSSYEATRRLEGNIELPKQNITIALSNCSLQRKYAQTRFGGEVFLQTGFVNWTKVYFTQYVLFTRTKERTETGREKRTGMSATALGLREGSRFFSLELHDTSLPNTSLAVFTQIPKPVFGFTTSKLFLEKQTNDKAAQVNISGYFYSLPVLLNSEFKLSLVDSLFILPRPRLMSLVRRPQKQLFDAFLSCTTSDAKNHTADISWRFARHAEQPNGSYAFNTSALLKSDYLPQKEITFSLTQPFGWYPSLRGSLRSGVIHNFTYSLNCTSFFLPPECFLLVENLSPSQRSFEKAELTLKRPKADGPIYLRLTVDENHKAVVQLLYTSEPQTTTLLCVNSSLEVNGTLVFDTRTTLKQAYCNRNYYVLLESSEKWRRSAGEQSQISVWLCVNKTNNGAKASAGLDLTTSTNTSEAKTIGGYITCSKWSNIASLLWRIDSLSSGSVVFYPSFYKLIVDLNLKNTFFGFPVNIKGSTNLLFLLLAIKTQQYQPPEGVYFLEAQNSRISVGLQTEPTVNFTLLCRLLDFNQSLAFQTAFAFANTRYLKRLKLDLELEEPQAVKLLFDWSLLPDDTEKLGVTDVASGIGLGTLIPKTIITVFVQPPGHSRPRHLKLTLASKVAQLDAFLRSCPGDSKHEVGIDFQSPQNSTPLASFVLTGQCSHRLTADAPCQINYRTAVREACVSVRRTARGISSELAWNRLRNGTVQMHVNDTVWSFETPRRMMSVGRMYALAKRRAMGYFLKISPKDQNLSDYVEVFAEKPGQVAIRSTWLKSPIGAKWEYGGNNFSFNLYAGLADRKCQDLITLTFVGGKDGQGHFFFKNAENTFDAHTFLWRSGIAGVHLLANFTLNAKNGTAILTYLPRKRLFAVLSDQVEVEISAEQSPEQVSINFTSYLLGGEIQANGRLVLLKDPFILFATVRSITSEGLLRLEMKDYLNFDAEILHSPLKGPKVHDARLITRLDDNNRYNLQFFWRPEAISELLANGFKNFTQDEFESTIVKLLDPFFLMAESEIVKIWQLLNHSAVYESFIAALEEAVVMMDTLDAFKNDGICLIGLLENVTIASIRYLRDALSPNSLSSTYQAFHYSAIKAVDKVEEVMQNFLNTTRSAAVFVRTVNVTGRFGERVFKWLQNGVSDLFEASYASFATLSKSLHRFGTTIANIFNKVGSVLAKQVAGALDALSKAFSQEGTEFMEAVEAVTLRLKEDLSYLLSFVASQDAVAALQDFALGNISGAIKKYFRPEDNQYIVDWEAVSVNASIHLPQELLQATSLPIVFCGGRALQPASWLQRIVQTSGTLLREFADPEVYTSLRNASDNITESLKYNAWLFLTPQIIPKVIGFDGGVRDLSLTQNTLFVLARDIFEDTFSLMLLTSEDDFEFHLVYDGQKFMIDRQGNVKLPMRTISVSGLAPIKPLMTIKNRNHWLLAGTYPQFTIVFDMFHDVLWVQLGAKWFGRLDGLFGSTTKVPFSPALPAWTAQKQDSSGLKWADRFKIKFDTRYYDIIIDDTEVAKWFAPYASCNSRIVVKPFLTMIALEKHNRHRELVCSALAAYAYACDGPKDKDFVNEDCAATRENYHHHDPYYRYNLPYRYRNY